MNAPADFDQILSYDGVFVRLLLSQSSLSSDAEFPSYALPYETR